MDVHNVIKREQTFWSVFLLKRTKSTDYLCTQGNPHIRLALTFYESLPSARLLLVAAEGERDALALCGDEEEAR